MVNVHIVFLSSPYVPNRLSLYFNYAVKADTYFGKLGTSQGTFSGKGATQKVNRAWSTEKKSILPKMLELGLRISRAMILAQSERSFEPRG